MKKWIAVTMLTLVFAMCIPTESFAQSAEWKPSAEKELKREIRERKAQYLKLLVNEKISADFYLYVVTFLDNKRALLTEENAVDEYNEFPEEYVDLLYAYQDESMNTLAELIEDLINYPDAMQVYIDIYESEMDVLEEELAIYGFRENFSFDEEDYPILTAKG